MAMYVEGNPKSKAQIKKDLAAGKKMYVYQPGLGTVPENGIIDLCGPISHPSINSIAWV